MQSVFKFTCSTRLSDTVTVQMCCLGPAFIITIYSVHLHKA